MHAAVCGFAFVEQPILKVLQKIMYESDDGSSARTVKAIPGGWGAVWLSVNNLICLSKQTLLEGTEAAILLVQVDNQLPGVIKTSAVGWNYGAAVSVTGQLYGSQLADPQLLDAAVLNQQSSPSSAIISWRLLGPLAEHVQEVAIGEQHSAALTEDGTVLTWGRNDNGQLGNISLPTGTKCNSPTAVAGPEANHSKEPEASQKPAGLLNGAHWQMRTIACGARHTCSVSCTGQVYCWGWDLHGQCGQGRSTVTIDQPQPVKALGGLIVMGIAAGLAHTVACTDSGAVFAWGWNSDGQLGLGDDQNRCQPELVDASILEDEHIDKVCCGARHTVVKSSQGNVFAWGWNKYGQLGLGDTENRQLPHLLKTKVNDIACGWWHTLVTYDSDQK